MWSCAISIRIITSIPSAPTRPTTFTKLSSTGYLPVLLHALGRLTNAISSWMVRVRSAALANPTMHPNTSRKGCGDQRLLYQRRNTTTRPPNGRRYPRSLRTSTRTRKDLRRTTNIDLGSPLMGWDMRTNSITSGVSPSRKVFVSPTYAIVLPRNKVYLFEQPPLRQFESMLQITVSRTYIDKSQQPKISTGHVV